MAKDRGMDSQFYGMISEDHSAVANLPKEPVQKPYPKSDFLGAYELDDTIRGLDECRRDDIRNVEKHASKDKY